MKQNRSIKLFRRFSYLSFFFHKTGSVVATLLITIGIMSLYAHSTYIRLGPYLVGDSVFEVLVEEERKPVSKSRHGVLDDNISVLATSRNKKGIPSHSSAYSFLIQTYVELFLKNHKNGEAQITEQEFPYPTFYPTSLSSRAPPGFLVGARKK